MYFPNAYKKVFVVNAFKEAGGTQDLLPGEFGFFSPKTWTAVPTAAALAAQNPMVILAAGSNHKVDKIGSHGGYKESVKSQGINPRFIHRFFKVNPKEAVNQILKVGFNGTAGTAPVFYQGELNQLRIDLKGSPVLRFMQRNIYHVFDAKIGEKPVDEVPVKVDPVAIFLQWKAQIEEDPIFSQFISATVRAKVGIDPEADVDPATYVAETDEAAIADISASMVLNVAYADTKFGACTWDPKDHYELEPVVIYASLIDESNLTAFKSITVTETQSPVQAEGVGETILRDLILFNRYRQEHYDEDKRKGETKDQDAITTDVVDRSLKYTTYGILHSVPRKANPSSTLDADQYLLSIHVQEGAIAAFEAWMDAYLDSAATGVQLEVFNA